MFMQGQSHDGISFVSGIAWSGTVNVPPQAAYVVVYTNPHFVGQTLPYEDVDSGYAYAGTGGPVVVPGSGPYKREIPIGATGVVKLRVRTH
jgi:hypothetical protein